MYAPFIAAGVGQFTHRTLLEVPATSHGVTKRTKLIRHQKGALSGSQQAS